MASLALPPAKIASVPPLETTVTVATPPEETGSWPPLRTVVERVSLPVIVIVDVRPLIAAMHA